MKIKLLVIASLLALGAIGTVAVLPALLPMWEENRPRASVVVDALVANTHRHYVFSDEAQQIETLLRAQQQGAYDALSDAAQLAERLSAGVASVAHDLHMEVRASVDLLPPQPTTDFRSQPVKRAGSDQDAYVIMRVINNVSNKMGTFGVARVDHIMPHIAYLKMANFVPPHLAADKYGAAMDKLADADAMIIDLRDNGGGYPHSVALPISYFVDQRTRLNDLWLRDTGQTQQFWTEEQLAGTRFGGVKPVAILVGPETKSVGEDFAYTMQALKRATVMGERA